MGFTAFFLAEYSNMLLMSFLIVICFFKGWLGVFGVFSYFLKVLFFSLSLIWVRATLPRYRYDQLMALGWKTILPIVISYFMFFACFLIFVDSFWLFDERSALLMLPVRVALETDTLLEPFWIPPETL